MPLAINDLMCSDRVMLVCLDSSFRIFIVSDETRQVNMISRSVLAKFLVGPEHNFAFLFKGFVEWVIDVLYFDFMKQLVEFVVQIVALNP